MFVAKSRGDGKASLSGRRITVRVLIAALVGALIVPTGSVIFPSVTTSAYASLTASTSSASYVDVPFTCSPSFYQTAAPNQTNYPAATDGNSPRLFTYDPITNSYSGSTKTIPEGDGSTPNAIGYNTLDNFIYGVYLPKAGSTYGTAGLQYIVRIDSTGNYKLLGTYTSTFNPISGDFWKNGSENRFVIHAGGNFAYLDVTNTGNQAAVPLSISGTTPATLDVTILGNTMYGLRGTTLFIVNLNTLVGTSKTVSQLSSSGSTPILAGGVLGTGGHSFGSAFADSGGNLYFFNNVTAQVWMIEATEIGKDSPQIQPLGSGTAVMEGSTAGVTLPNDGASCPNAGSAYSTVISDPSVSNLSTTSATISTTVNPIGTSTTAQYCYGTTSTTSGGALQNCTLTAQPVNASDDNPLTGTSPLALDSLEITGLPPGTTHYWQTVTTSSWAITYGSVNSFTTLGPPIVSTAAATSITSTSAVLRGFIDPENNTTAPSFCYATSPALADCTSLSGEPSSLTGTSNTAVSLTLSGLTPGTTYYFKSVATYSGEPVSGSTLNFTTLAPPSVTRSLETNVTSLGAQLNGSVNPQGTATTVSFCVGTNSNLTGCSVVNANESPLIGTSTSSSVSANIGSLTASTTYYYNISATNTNGASSSTIFSFTTAALPLEVTTQNGGLPPGTVGVAYSSSLVAAGGSQPYSWTVKTGSLPSGLSLGLSSGVISGTPESAGNSTFTIEVTDSTNDSTLKVFTMSVDGSPTVTTDQVSLITGTTATLNGVVNPQNLLTAVSFCYGTNANFSDCSQVVASQSPLAAGTSDASVHASIQGLTAGTTYYVRINASNNSGATLGNSISFTTSAFPTVTTGAASSLTQTGTGATLNAVVNPKSSQTAVSFCYSQSPTLVGCTSIPATPSTLASSTQPSAVSADISSLSANTVYYFNAVATNNVGTAYGSTGSFTTPTGTVAAPVITGIAPESIGDISGASVTITGTGFSTTGAGAQVTIGGISGTVTSRSATQLVVTSPAGTSGFSNVVVNNVDGQSASTSSRLSFTSSAPTNVSGTVDNAQSEVTWTATPSTGPAVSNYLVQYSSNGGDSWTSVARSASTAASMSVTGLVNGSGYIFRVAAINSVGTGTFSSSSSEVIPRTLPGQPTDLAGNAGNGQATLSWVAPSDNGGQNIITYKVDYSSNGGASWTEYVHPNSSSTSLVVTGLNNGTSYTFRVAATNSVGTGSYSSSSATVNLVAPLSLAFRSRPVGVVLGEPAGTHSVSATTSPSNTGQIIFASATPSICAVNPSSGSLTFLAIGTCSITANNAGTTNYSAAPQQTQDIPVSSGSLAGLDPDDLEFLTSASVVGSTRYTLSASSADTELTLTIPSNALPSGTLVKIYLNKNLATAGQSITSTSYLLNFVVGWMNTNDGSLPIATSPLVVTAVNPAIKKGMVGYGILNGVPTPLGTATSDGSITLYMVEDPLLVVAPTIPGSPTGVVASAGLSQSSVVGWTVPNNDGGEPITSYEATASPGGSTCTVNGATATSCTMSNLQDGTNYTFTVQAINQVGRSNPSSASIAVAVGPSATSGDTGGGDTGGGGTNTNTNMTTTTTTPPLGFLVPTQPTLTPRVLPSPFVSPPRDVDPNAGTRGTFSQGAPAPERNRVTNALPDLNPGQYLATSAGIPEVVTIEALPDTREIAVVAGEWGFNVSLPADGGVVDQVAAGATVTLVQSRSATVSGYGFQPGTRADIWLLSTPTLLASVDVGADGSFAGDVYLDSRIVATGEHTLQLQGFGMDGLTKAANLGVVVQESVALPTNGATAAMVWVGAVAVVFGVALLVARRRRTFSKGRYTTGVTPATPRPSIKHLTQRLR